MKLTQINFFILLVLSVFVTGCTTSSYKVHAYKKQKVRLDQAHEGNNGYIMGQKRDFEEQKETREVYVFEIIENRPEAIEQMAKEEAMVENAERQLETYEQNVQRNIERQRQMREEQVQQLNQIEQRHYQLLEQQRSEFDRQEAEAKRKAEQAYRRANIVVDQTKMTQYQSANYSNENERDHSDQLARKVQREITNVSGQTVQSVTVTKPNPGPVLAQAQTYVVERNDTLQKISNKFYGKYSHWTDIYKANQDVLKDPNSIRPGMELVIPAL